MNDLVTVAGQLPAVDTAARARLLRFEERLAQMPQRDLPVHHYFADGLYSREITIPAGVALVGYIHMQDCITTVSRGVIMIGDGEQPRLFSAPYTLAVPAGTKKAGWALRDTVWTDCYANPDNERRIDVLEARLTAGTHAEFLQRLEHRP